MRSLCHLGALGEKIMAGARATCRSNLQPPTAFPIDFACGKMAEKPQMVITWSQDIANNVIVSQLMSIQIMIM